ncbi:MAG: M23 family metallopeptidase [Planctomycetes bacterium]|nr:M23 family metallopeptidase [Planctomycetota bacterium]
MSGPWIALVVCAAVAGASLSRDEKPPSAPVAKTTFVLPCEGYMRALERGGNFGLFVTGEKSPFKNSYHLAEDVWLKGGTPVHAIGDGIVRYSDFSPTWTDKAGVVHWNLGNVIVIEHALKPPIDDLDAVCSFYVHLAADRRVKTGDRVERGQIIGRIGADKSAENGRYPAHLHFGIHRGPYFQISPAFERDVRRAAASKDGLRAGPDVLRGELKFRLNGESSVLVTSVESGTSILLSLLVGSTAPENAPADIMNWCQGYGPQDMLAEWLEPSAFIAAHAAPVSKSR